MNSNSSLSFDQLPNAVGELLSKVDTMLSQLEDIGGKLTNTPHDDQHVIMNIKEAATFLHKEVSTLYMLTLQKDASPFISEAILSISSKTSW